MDAQVDDKGERSGRSLIYLDHAAATPVLPEVVATHAELCRRYVVNPHVGSRLGEEARRALEQAEARLLRLLGVPRDSAHVVWTSGGTEAMNLACLGVLRRHARSAALVDPTGHAALLAPCRHYAQHENGRCQAFRATADGQLDLPAAPSPDMAGTALVAVGHVNNETGVVHDLPRLRAWLTGTAPKALLAVDAIQAFGKLDIPWHEARIDLLAVSGRKIGGPAQVAALIRRKDIALTPLLFGGGQQQGLRSGTVDVVGVLGFVQAAELVCARQRAEFDRIAVLNRHTREQVRTRLARWQARLISPDSASPYILSVSFPGFEGAVLMRTLAERGIAVGVGAACSAESAKPSHVLSAMGVGERGARGVLRISFGATSTTADVDALVTALDAVLAAY